jgi:hypothetical protein
MYEWQIHSLNKDGDKTLRLYSLLSGNAYRVDIDLDDLDLKLFPENLSPFEHSQLRVLNHYLRFEDAVACLATWKYTEPDEWLFKSSLNPVFSMIEDTNRHLPCTGKLLTKIGVVKIMIMEKIKNEFIVVNLSSYYYYDNRFTMQQELVPAYTKMRVRITKVSF